MLQRPCPECGLDTNSFAREAIPAMIRANAAAWREPLGAPDVVRRPQPGKWSALEYGCHVRDVLKLYDYRLSLMLTEDDPLLMRQRYPVPGAPYGLAYDPKRDLLWVTLTATNEVVAFDVAGGEPEEKHRFPTVEQPNNVAVDPISGRVIVASATGKGIQVIAV